jgi:hypothetical protein
MKAIDILALEWDSLGRSPASAEALSALAGSDPLVRQVECSTLHELAIHMGKARPDDSAVLVRIMLREAPVHPLISRCLLQVLTSGMCGVAARLRWGDGGEWLNRDDFFTDLISVTWEVIAEWAGEDRQWAMLDILSASRGRMRRRLFKERDLFLSHVELGPWVDVRSDTGLTGIELLAQELHELDRGSDVDVLYATAVLGYTVPELSVMTEWPRNTLYKRRNRARRLVAS